MTSPAAAPEAPPEVIPARQVFTALAVVTGLGAVIVLLIGRFPVPTLAAAVALAVQSILCHVLVALEHRVVRDRLRALRLPMLALLGLLTAFSGWFFGANAGFAAAVALALVLAGVASGGGASFAPAPEGWVTLVTLAGGQLTVLVLVLARVIPDASLTRVIVEGHPTWHHLVSHLALQAVYLSSYLVGWAFQRRYAALARRVEDAVHSAARREALLDEARAEYLRMLGFAKLGVMTDRVVDRYRIGSLVERDETTEVYAAVTDDGTQVTLRVAPRADGEVQLEALDSLEPMPLDRAQRLAQDVGSSLSALHVRGMSHGAVCRASIVHAGEEGFRLLDPGTEGSPDPGSTELLRYLAPERIEGHPPDPSGDVYGLAAVLYAAITGREPYAGVAKDDLAATILRRLPAPPPGDTPAPVRDVLRVGLARRAADRFATPAELFEAFDAATHDELEPVVAARARALDATTPWAPLGTPVPPSVARTHDVEESATRIEPPEPDTLDTRWESAEDTTVERTGEQEPAVDPWARAYHAKLRGYYRDVTILCLAGAGLLAVIGREPGSRVFAFVCIALIVVLIQVHRWLYGMRGRVGEWPFAAIAALSVGPAFLLGLHSGFGAVLALWLFTWGVFSPSGSRRGRIASFVALLVAHSLLFALIWSGVVPDAGNVPVLQEGRRPWEPGVLHVLLSSVYVVAFLAGEAVNRRYETLVGRAEEAARIAAQRDVLLAAAREELDLAQARAVGIFTGTAIGPYEIVNLLGRGGMGEVYEAREWSTGRRVALKVVRGERLADPMALRMLLSEADALTRIESARVGRVLAVADPDAQVPYIAMELVEGDSLARILREQETLDLEEARRLVADVCRGLEDVHEAGLLHCDVKPSNVIRTADGRFTIVDFGVSRRLDQEGDGIVAGTPGYMAPEQALGRKLDGRADVYSVGMVVYRALTGRPAYTGGNRREVAQRALAMAPPSPHAQVDLPEEVGLVLRLAVAAVPEDRFASARELMEAFVDAVHGRLAPDVRRRAEALLARQPWGAENTRDVRPTP